LALQNNNVKETVTAEQARGVRPNVPEPDPLALQEAKNAHENNMHKNERGWVGAVFGSRSEKPGNVALIVILLCFVFAMLAFVHLDMAKDSELFFKLLSVVSGLVSLALGYLFGSSDRR
jgi:hypothetical protein